MECSFLTTLECCQRKYDLNNVSMSCDFWHVSLSCLAHWFVSSSKCVYVLSCLICLMVIKKGSCYQMLNDSWANIHCHSTDPLQHRLSLLHHLPTRHHPCLYPWSILVYADFRHRSMCNEEENGDYREEDEEVKENNPHLMPERDANGNIIVRPYGRV